MYYFQKDGVCFWESLGENYKRQSIRTLTIFSLSMERLEQDFLVLAGAIENSHKSMLLWGATGRNISPVQEFKLLKAMRREWGENIVFKKNESSGIVSYVRKVNVQEENDILEKMGARHNLLFICSNGLNEAPRILEVMSNFDNWVTPDSIGGLEPKKLDFQVTRTHMTDICSVIQFFGNDKEIQGINDFFVDASYKEVDEEEVPKLLRTS